MVHSLFLFIYYINYHRMRGSVRQKSYHAPHANVCPIDSLETYTLTRQIMKYLHDVSTDVKYLRDVSMGVKYLRDVSIDVKYSHDVSIGVKYSVTIFVCHKSLVGRFLHDPSVDGVPRRRARVRGTNPLSASCTPCDSSRGTCCSPSEGSARPSSREVSYTLS